MVEVVFSASFEKEFKKIRHATVKEHILKQVEKIVENPELGKPLRYSLKGERTIYVKPYRIIYAYNKESITFLVFEHRDTVYD